MIEQLEFFEIPSPCIGVCQANNRGYCKGCLRSRHERQVWLQLTAMQKRDVVRLCQQRKARVLAAKAQQAGNEQLELIGDGEQPELF